eukprot:3979394-Amphidinium_carterae.1
MFILKCVIGLSVNAICHGQSNDHHQTYWHPLRHPYFVELVTMYQYHVKKYHKTMATSVCKYEPCANVDGIDSIEAPCETAHIVVHMFHRNTVVLQSMELTSLAEFHKVVRTTVSSEPESSPRPK